MDDQGKDVGSTPVLEAPVEGWMLGEDVVREVLARMARGEPVKTVARELGVDKKTIKRWRQRGAWRPRAAPPDCAHRAARGDRAHPVTPWPAT